MTNIEKIRAALEQAGEYIRSDLASERGAFEGYEGVSRIDEIKADLANNKSAIAALAELERAAAELESRITRMKTLLGECREVIAWECNELSNDPRGREDEHRRLGRLVDAIDTARAGNGGGV